LLSAFGDSVRVGVTLDARFADLEEFCAKAFAMGPRVACFGFAARGLDFALAFDVACETLGFHGAGLTSGDPCVVLAGAFDGEPGAAAAANGATALAGSADSRKAAQDALATPTSERTTSASFEKRQRER
jgi:hypothetical protein